MAKTKYYAVKNQASTTIVESWAECEKITRGVKGVLFKSFSSRQEAEAWLHGVSEPSPPGIRIYVDGSFTEGFEYSGWGFIVVDEGKEIARKCGITREAAESRNIDGELTASYEAMRWLFQNQKTGTLCHDYEGIARFAKGEWRAKSNIAKRYVQAVAPYLHLVHFEKVEAHSGIKWNEAVDALAKSAIAYARQKGLPKNNSKVNESEKGLLNITDKLIGEKQSQKKEAMESEQTDLFG